MIKASEISPTHIQGQSIAVNLSSIPRHMPALDGVRGLAILMVMWYHFAQVVDASELGIYGKFAILGQCGVDLFFVLSGFLITGILLDNKFAHHYFRAFYARRILRIFPLYFGVLFVTFLIIPLFIPPEQLGYADAFNSQLWLWTYTVNIAHYIDHRSTFSFFHHFWSLAYEEQFYLCWPAIVWLLSRRTIVIVCAFGILGSFLVTRADSLLFGALIATLSRSQKGLAPYRKFLIVLAILSGFALIMLIAFAKDAWELNMWLNKCKYQPVSLFFASALPLVANISPRSCFGWFFHSRVLRCFGKYAYGLYVFHGIFLPWLHNFVPVPQLQQRFGSITFGVLINSAVATVLMLIISALSFHFFEAPLLSLKRFFEYSK